jgi:hypothetical protein
VRYLVRSFAIGALRRGKDIERFLSVSQKYEIWLQLIRQEATMAEAVKQMAVKQMAVKLTLVEGKGAGAEWPGPTPGGRGHEELLAGPHRARRRFRQGHR